MNPGSFQLIRCFIAIIAINSVYSASDASTSLYEPLYIMHFSNEQYLFAQDVRYDNQNENYYVVESGKEISTVCPNEENPESYEIKKTEKDKMILGRSCEKPVRWSTHTSVHLTNAFAIGIAVHSPNRRPIEAQFHVAKDHEFLGLIFFKIDTTNPRPEFVFYRMAPGRFLEAEPSPKRDVEFERNQYFYGFDIDKIYSKPGCPFVKVPLAPEEDQFFENWKPATRYNILTAPMWPELLPQWRALEIFIRKVTQVISAVHMMTGIHGSLRGTDKQTIMYLNDEDPTNPKYPIPEYFWKAITLTFVHEGKEFRSGIIFVMHNTINPNNVLAEPKICPEDGDVASENGWKFLPDDQQFESLMYACLYNEENVAFFQENMAENLPDFDEINLNDLTLLQVDAEGNESIKPVNVLVEMRKLEEEGNENSSSGGSENEQAENEEIQQVKRRRLNQENGTH